MVDYKKFDHIIDSDEEDNNPQINPKASEEQMKMEKEWREQQEAKLHASSPGTSVLTKKGKEGNRLKFEYGGKTIYEWEQTLSEVILYIEPPPGVNKKMFDISIQPHHLKVGIKGNSQLFLDEDTAGPVKPDESMWMIADGELIINLQKMYKAETWESALKGHRGQTVDAFTKEQLKKQMMIERFQEENPGFDFSSAEFNGQIPDAREFMGGVKHF
jgi:hypothetical protein